MLRRGWEVFAENKLALASLGLALFMIGFCFVGPLIYHTDQVHTNLQDVLCPPSASHPLGCDNVGYDVLGRLMIAGQTSIEVGVAAAIVAVLFGTLYGALAGFVGGPLDSFMMRLVDAGLSIPYITVLIMLSVIFHPNKIIMIFVIAVFYWLAVARLIRGETLTLRTREYVQAVKVIGGRKQPRDHPAHRAERDRHDHRSGHLRGRGRHHHPRRPRLPRPRRPAAGHRLGRDALRRPDSTCRAARATGG